MANPITFRDMQNPDQPNLPFAQRTNATMFRDMQNPDQPDLPFSQSSVMSSRSKKCYNVTTGSGSSFSGTYTDSIANYYRQLGYTLVPCSEVNDDKPASSPHWTKSEIKEMIEKYHGDDIKLLHDNVTGLGNAMTRAKQHRDSNAQKIENLITQRQDISTKLVNLGTSVSDVSSALGTHKAEFDLHKTHEIIPTIPNPFGDIPTWLILGALGLVLVMRK